jgi:glutathione gamma-glutamylcysteinyltransferase
MVGMLTTGKDTGDGHFSPVGGYHKGRDLVLILDTARFKYPPHWVPLSELHAAMAHLDSATGRPRGAFLLLSHRVCPHLLWLVGIRELVLLGITR